MSKHAFRRRIWKLNNIFLKAEILNPMNERKEMIVSTKDVFLEIF